jgi:hypothetical protein
MNPDETYRRCRSKFRRRPAWWLRYRARQIVSRRPWPDGDELAQLAAIRRELRMRVTGSVRADRSAG